MIYLLHGKDTYRSREKLRELEGHFVKRVTGTGLFRVTRDDFSAEKFEELVKSDILFGGKHAVVSMELLSSPESRGNVQKFLPDMAESPNIFIFWEEEINEEILYEVKKYAEKVQEFKRLSGAKLEAWVKERARGMGRETVREIINDCGGDLWRVKKNIEYYLLGGEEKNGGGKKDSYKLFAVPDAIATRDGKRAWVGYNEGVMLGVEPTEIFWKVWWQIKVLLIVHNILESGGSEDDVIRESGLHPFVARKALWNVKRFTGPELKNYSWRLVQIYHDERRGISNLEVELEKFILDIV